MHRLTHSAAAWLYTCVNWLMLLHVLSDVQQHVTMHWSQLHASCNLYVSSEHCQMQTAMTVVSTAASDDVWRCLCHSMSVEAQ